MGKLNDAMGGIIQIKSWKMRFLASLTAVGLLALMSTSSTSYAQSVDPTCGPLTQEAERAVLSGKFEIANDSAASGGAFVHVPAAANLTNSQSNDQARFCFNVPSSGEYQLKGAVLASGGGDSFFVTINGEPIAGYLWDLGRKQTYTEEYVSDRNNSQQRVSVFMAAGENTVTVSLREAGSRLDTLTLEAISSSEPVPPDVTVSSCGSLTQEAERAVLSGGFDVVSDQTASGGAFVHVPETANLSNFQSDTQAQFCFTVPNSGEYQLKGAVLASGSGDSFFVTVNGEPSGGYLWDLPRGQTYDEEYVSDRNNNRQRVGVFLPAGENIVTVSLREAGARLDNLTLEAVNSSAPVPQPIQPIQPIQPVQPPQSVEPFVSNSLGLAQDRVVGDIKLLLLRFDYPDARFGQPNSEQEALWAEGLAALDRYYRRQSNGKITSITYDYPGYFDLETPLANITGLADINRKSRAKAQQLFGVNLNQYDIVIHAIPSGLAIPGASGGGFGLRGTIWLPTTKQVFITEGLIHEFGHGIGMGHSAASASVSGGVLPSDNYEGGSDPYAMMGSGGSSVRGDWALMMKHSRGWIEDSQLANCNSSRTIRIYASSVERIPSDRVVGCRAELSDRGTLEEAWFSYVPGDISADYYSTRFGIDPSYNLSGLVLHMRGGSVEPVMVDLTPRSQSTFTDRLQVYRDTMDGTLRPGESVNLDDGVRRLTVTNNQQGGVGEDRWIEVTFDWNGDSPQ